MYKANPHFGASSIHVLLKEGVLVNIERWTIEDAKVVDEGTIGRYSRSLTYN